MKICPKCKEEKAFDQFYLNRKTKLGIATMCKACDNARRRKQGKVNFKKYGRKYRKRPESKVKLWCKHQVLLAKRAGLLASQPCQVCGSATRIEGHHDNYFLPLNVMWLCRSHHRQRHFELNEIAKSQGKEAHPFFQIPEQVGPNTLQGKLL